MHNASIVIISDARRDAKITKQTLASLGKGYEVIVVEGDKNTTYPDCKTIHPVEDKFNYNKYLNFGAKFTTKDYIVFCNNDLIFEKNWWSKMHSSMAGLKIRSASPLCPSSHREYGFEISDISKEGTQTRKFVAGWCLALNKDWYQKMGGFDERLAFWCADNSYTEQLNQFGEKHILVLNSVVHHVGSVTLNTLDPKTQRFYTEGQVKKFNKIYKKNIFDLGT